MARSTRVFVALGAMTAITCATSTTGASAQGAPVCVIETYEWIGDARMFLGGPLEFSTGVTIPPAEPGQTLTMLEAVYDSYDEYPVGQVPSRAEADQANEIWRLEIGGVPFGSPTGDLPDTVAEGARDDYYGERSGTLGTGPITGGEITGIHAGLFGFTESPNSVIARGLDVRVERCSEPPPTTPPPTPTTPPPTPGFAFSIRSECRNDVPVIAYESSMEGVAPGTEMVLHWIDATGVERLTQTVALGSGEILWPGAEVDAAGNPTDWPGWILQSNGEWVEGPDGFEWARPQMFVFATVNPTSPTLGLTYPPSTPRCQAQPPDTGLTTLPATGDVSQRPLTTIGAFLLAIGAGLVVVNRRSAARHRA